MENSQIELLTGISVPMEKAASVLTAKGEMMVANQKSAESLAKEMKVRGYLVGIAKPSAWIYKVILLGKMRENKE